MIVDRFFCAAQSRASGERIFGTVAQIESWLLLEYSGPWGRHAIEASRLAPDVKKWLHGIKNTEPRNRQLLVRQGHSSSGPFRCFVVRSCAAQPRVASLGFSDYRELAGTDLVHLEASPDARQEPRPIYTVCTHGTHDRCCSKFDLPVYEALRRLAGDRVWQCSHVGGDRFAANVVLFPYGIYYGHVAPEDVPELVARSECGDILLRNYRGRCCFPRVAQVGEFLVRSQSRRMGIEEFRLAGLECDESERSQVRFEAMSDGTKYEVELRAVADRLMGRLTCTATASSPIPQYEVVRYSVRSSGSR